MYSNFIYYMAPDTIGAVSIPDLEIEHCLPKGWWGGKASSNENDAFMDLHHLNPANARANNNKSDCPPGNVTSSESVINPLFKKGKNLEYGNFYVFEPCDEYKGDFARAYFYIATAYENFIWQSAASNYMTNDSYQEFKPWLRDVLLEWHKNDPVSEKEINRNNRVSDIQHNRNPYIDYPELVEYIWGKKQGQAVNLSTLEFTGDEDYELPIETLVSRALPASGITKNGFIAHWKNAGKESYMLNVFTTTTTGHNDTILNMPYFTKAAVQADTHFSYNGDYFGVTGIGKASVTFYKSSNRLVLTISGLTIPADSRIVIRAMAPQKLNGTDGATLKITSGSTVIADQVLTNDELYYTFALPAGNDNIIIEPGLNKAINVQQLFIISGDETTTHTSLTGFPKEVSGTAYAVEHAMQESETVYYTVTPNGLRTSMPVAVTYDGPDTPTELSHPETNQPSARKELRNGQIVIIRNSAVFSTFGQLIR
jgi:endonuclease I